MGKKKKDYFGKKEGILQTHLLFSPLATILQLACERQDVVLPNLKALRVHEPDVMELEHEERMIL